MESSGKQWIHRSYTYRIVVRGELSERFAMAFEGMEVSSADGRTIIAGEVTDQSHLHGILDRIRSLGLELVSVQRVSEEPQTATQ
jgi:hypothetical protein